MRPPLLSLWASADSPARVAVESLDPVFALQDLPAILSTLAKLPGDTAFLVVRLGPGDRAALAQVIRLITGWAIPWRICLAVREEHLGLIDFASVDHRRVGFMLDQVDASTSLASLACPDLEAVRFNDEFFELARSNLRLGFVLDAMLGLATDLGLCTLGPRLSLDKPADPGACRFDYSPAATRPASGTGRRHSEAPRATPTRPSRLSATRTA